MDLVDTFPSSLGDDYFVELDAVRVYFNTLTKVKRKVAEFGGPEGWKICPCRYNDAACTTVVFDAGVLPEMLARVCELFHIQILELERMPTSRPEDMSLLITSFRDARANC